MSDVWTERISEIERMISEGWTYAEIALHYGVSRSAIKSAMYRLKLTQHEILKDRGEGIKSHVKGNTIELESKKGLRIRTLKQLLAACHVNMDEWEVDHHIVNTWENYSVKDGYNTLYQVKAWLIRKEPIAIQPTIDPVYVEIREIDLPSVDVTSESSGILVISDPQIGYTKSLRTAKLTPFHDRRVLEAAVSFADTYQPDTIAFIGDTLDLADWSDHFLREPNFKYVTQPAIEETAWWLGRFREACPNARIFLLEGNHEKRMVDVIAKYNPECYELRSVNNLEGWPVVSIPYLLGLDDLGIEWVPGYPGNRKIINDIVFEHGVKTAPKSGATIRKVLDDSVQSRVVGHAHKGEMAYRRLGTGQVIFAVSCPCACLTNGTVPGSDEDDNWTQGVVYIEALTKYNVAIPHIMPFHNGRLYYNDEIYTARYIPDIVEDLLEATDQRWNY